MYKKIIKYAMWALLIVSVIVIVWGCLKGLTANGAVAIDAILYWAYALVALALICIFVFGIGISAIQDKKNLIKIALVLVGLVALVGVAYVLAPASPAVGLVNLEPTHGELKLTDTVLNLTYITCGAAIVSILFSAISGALRK